MATRADAAASLPRSADGSKATAIAADQPSTRESASEYLFEEIAPPEAPVTRKETRSTFLKAGSGDAAARRREYAAGHLSWPLAEGGMMGSVTSPAAKRNDLQWLRALAAIEVVIWHSDLATKGFSGWLLHDSIYRTIGGIGVEVFFILSGYVICMQLPKYRSAGEFMLSRIYRLAPLYWLFTSLVLVTALSNPSWRLHGLNFEPMHILLSLAFAPQPRTPVLGLGWTLELEMVFYVAVAIAVALTRSHQEAKRWVLPLLACLGVIGVILGTGPAKRTWEGGVLSPYMLTFGLGWFYRLLDENSDPRARRIAWGVCGVVVVGALLLAHGPNESVVWRTVVAGAIFKAFCHWRHHLERRTPLNLLAGRIGDASYSIYLSHWFALSAAGKVLAVVGVAPVLDPLVRIAGIPLCVALGCLLFTVLEKPIDRALRGGGSTMRTSNSLANT